VTVPPNDMLAGYRMSFQSVLYGAAAGLPNTQEMNRLPSLQSIKILTKIPI
jgi:hypothetical protein